jgi:Tfp pilus assembly protein PilN
MINLLPPELKTGYRYARRNVGLRKWIAAFLIALLGLGALATYGLLTLQQSTRHYTDQIASTQAAFEKEQFSATQKRVLSISNDFKLVVKVLGQEVLFSQLLKQVAAIIPANANLTSLDIAQVQGAIDITANATDYNTATQVQVNLADPANKIFSKADIISINCSSANPANAQYPCAVNVRALFATNNPFLFINNKTGATP